MERIAGVFQALMSTQSNFYRMTTLRDATMAWWDEYLTEGPRAKLPADRLEFDDRNPRYTPDKRPSNSSDVAVVDYLYRTADLGELIQSIASGGYIDIEPLIVVPRDDKLVVLEGNRRLAALKALSSPKLAADANVPVPEITEAVRKSLINISVFKVDSEEEARELIGFKHINGPQAWDAYAKALYAARWLDEQADKGDSALSLTDMAARMGDKHDTLFRIVSAVYVLRQAQENDLFDVTDRWSKNFSFSHLYTALTYTEYREFLGLPRAERSVNPPNNPVSKENLPNLGILLRWLYGSKSDNLKPIVRTQNPDLSLLKRILGHPIARRVLLERNDLQEALQLTIDGSDRFQKALVDAHAALRAASSELSNSVADRELLSISEDILKRAEFISNHLQNAYRSQNPEK